MTPSKTQVLKERHAVDAESYARAILNILDDFSKEGARLGDTQRALLNILDDSNAEKVRLEVTQKAVLNILEDFDTEKRRVEEANLSLQERTSELARSNTELAHQGLHDLLTGLANRALFLDRLAGALARRKRDPAPLAVLFLDLDGFKTVNDSLGHEVGDVVLVEMGRRLAGLLRPSDTVARFGGDEFMILCDGLASEPDAIVLAERISAVVAEPLAVGGREFHLTASVGVAIAPDHGDSPEALIRNADASMYHAKERNAPYAVFDERIHARAVARLDMNTELHHALERDELRVLYQPQVRIDTGEVFGVEALVRWQHPARGLLAPVEFIAFAEQSGMIIPVGLWVLEQTCAQLRRWRDAGAPRVVGSVNISARQLLQADLAERVAAILANTEVDPSQLRFEITESMFISEPAAAAATLDRLKALGVGISVDDFGTGFTSLDALSRFPVDALKIDESFIRELGTDVRSMRVVSAILSLARALDLDVVAEGVELPAQLERLRELGCTSAQGYLFARPQAAQSVRKLLDQRLTGGEQSL